jgi:hypothetical protein
VRLSLSVLGLWREGTGGGGGGGGVFGVYEWDNYE